MPRIRPALALALLPLATACAAVPAERLGTAPPRSPVTAQEAAKAYAIDVYDPLEGFNRRVYRFNTVFDRWVFLPVAGGYQRVVPDPVRRSVGNFFRNLGEFRNGLNGALQARGEVFRIALARLAVNSTIGVLGLITTRDDIILAPGELGWLQKVFGPRATVLDTGGHCGNYQRRDFVDALTRFFRG